MISLLKAEFLKFKTNIILHCILVFGMVNVLLQSYLAYKEPGIQSIALWITGLDIFVSVVLPILIPVFVTFSYYMDSENSGIQLFTLKGISRKKLFYSKWIFYVMIISSYFLFGFFITIPFMFFRGLSISDIMRTGAPYILSSIIVIILLINISFILYIISKSYFIPPVISLVGLIIGSFNVGKWLPRFNVFSYLSRLLFIKTMNIADIIVILSMVIMSCCLLRLAGKLYVRNLSYEE